MNRNADNPRMEYRTLRKNAPEVDEEGKLSGRAAPFDSWTMIGSKPWGFREKISPGAFKKSINDGDVVLLDQHDAAKPLARQSAGTLELRESKDGLDWDATPADTSYARDARVNTKAGNYGGCSFGFEVIRDRWTYNGDDDVDERELLEVKLHEISTVTFPAYTDTSVSARDAYSAAFEARARFYERELRAKYNADELAALGKKGHAYKNPDGHYSYPIDDEADLDNAIHAVGRGGADHDAIRKYIIGRAKAMGLSSKIPDNWNSDGSIGEAKSAPVVTIAGDDYTDIAANLIRMYNELPEDQRAEVRKEIEKQDEEAERSEPVTPTREDERRRDALRMRSRKLTELDSTSNQPEG